MRVLALVALVSVMALHAAAKQPIQASAPPPLGKLVDAGGYKVHLYCTGHGSPTVVITGAGASFDWALVQPEVAAGTQVCAYDHSGSVWSERGPPDACSARVLELRNALHSAGVTGPLVLVGHSLGALVTRLYAATYPDQVAGVVIVDHATGFAANNVSLPAEGRVSSGSPVMGSRVPIGESTFQKLPPRAYALHQWANALPDAVAARRNNPALLAGCTADTDARTRGLSRPLGNKPLVVLHTNAGDPLGPSQYMQLQRKLAGLSTNSMTIQAERSSHYIMLDRPDLVIAAIQRVLAAARGKSRLSPN